MNLIYQLGENLFIKGNKVISYETHVASIKNNIIYEFGKFSRTTSKHISRVANILKLPVKTVNKNVAFFKYEMGIEPFKMEGALSPKTAIPFLQEGISTKEQVLSYVVRNMETLPNKDWSLIKEILELDPSTPHPRMGGKPQWTKIF